MYDKTPKTISKNRFPKAGEFNSPAFGKRFLEIVFGVLNKSIPMHRLLFILIITFLSNSLFAQLKPSLPKVENKTKISHDQLAPVKPIRANVPTAQSPFQVKNNFRPIAHLPAPINGQLNLQAYVSHETGMPYLIKGNFKTVGEKSNTEILTDYFDAVQPYLKMANPVEELHLTKTEKEEAKGFEHLHFQQTWMGIPVYGAEAKIHFKNKGIYLFNGHLYPTPNVADVTPTVSKNMAEKLVIENVSELTTMRELFFEEKQLIASEQIVSELVIYHLNKNPNNERLAWHITIIPNVAHRYAYFVDAKTGEILNHFSELCQIAGHFNTCNHENESCKADAPSTVNSQPSTVLDGPATANATDLFGITRLINTYDVNGDFFLMDASRPMFNFGQSSMPGEPVGVVWTIDGQNNSPENNSFQAVLIGTSNNVWNNPIAVSAHYNGGLAYEYFKNKFGRESINGQGGNIISLINITEPNGDDMDNAFWNGAAMWYGNGNQAFDQPLAKSPDVAGHEMSHGVVQATANLEYMGESGALNESFADVFGAMIDPDRDYQIGEDITNNSIFPTGSLRDMANPHNGGNNINDNGYQPAHYSERYTGSQDNGGVHSNSGITNKAFHLFAEAVGKNEAEQVYYRALTQYLFRSAQFIDCRIAVIQAATDLYGNGAATAAQDAFAAVGIGAGSGTNSQTDSDFNPGDDFILMTDDFEDQLYIFTPDGTDIADPLSNVSPLSRPSVTDDGSAIVYIAEDNTMRAIIIDWQASSVEQNIIEDTPMWRNVAVSKDGTHLAALTTDNDNELWIYDFGLEVWEIYDLYNPTTGQGGPTTGDVEFADVLEWDFTGEFVMYDALNKINTGGGAEIEYWDISFINVWDNDVNNFADGFTSKLFSQLPEDVSVGNPTFSKNSDYIIAFDYIDGVNDIYSLRAANIEVGEVGTIFNNGILNWPNYSMDDTRLVFDAEDTNGNPVLAFAPLASDKITPQGDASIYLSDKHWGVWFANGERDLVDAEELFAVDGISIYPNPVSNDLTLEWVSEISGEANIEVFDLLGKKIKDQPFEIFAGKMQQVVEMGGLPSGQYIVKLNVEGNGKAFRIIKN